MWCAPAGVCVCVCVCVCVVQWNRFGLSAQRRSCLVDACHHDTFDSKSNVLTFTADALLWKALLERCPIVRDPESAHVFLVPFWIATTIVMGWGAHAHRARACYLLLRACAMAAVLARTAPWPLAHLRLVRILCCMRLIRDSQAHRSAATACVRDALKPFVPAHTA